MVLAASNSHILKESSQDASVTADGATILFSHGGNVWSMDGDGNNSCQVTTSKRDAWNGEISPDGKWLVYGTADQGPFRVSLAGGHPISLDPYGGYPAISRDGRWIAFAHWDEKTKSNLIKIVPSDGGVSPRFLPFLPGTEAQQPDENLGDLPIRWTASGDAITYVRTKDDVSNIWAQPVSGEPAHQLTHFTSGYIWRHAWSPDGKWLALARGNFSIDAVLLTDLR
jgi:Tol biopolymer transport system component